ncbi:MipA/OmpV family protein [Pseudoalteromonas sp. KAN5]|uniref:MipA/OmpV family protein n=1 Tax=Pseudoalteromonas sp. KAN5 TaxID=2916633 RepID=UPI001FCAB2E8|nr:MipA/OmpV family protein [Pseudoalteromonas sp. KAN5]BDF93304.1 outer membrane MltA-interaction protein MipA [Pseudoalteromonas sp. KAN5]
MIRLLGLLFFVCVSASAQDELKQQQLIKKSTLHASITLGYGGIQNPVANSKNITSVILPNFAYYGDRWYVDDFALGYSLIENERYYIDIAGRFNEDGFFFELDGINKLFATSVMSDNLKAPTRPSAPATVSLTPIERDLSYLAGLSSGIKLFADSWVELAVLQDITNVHNGHEVQLNGYKLLSVLGGMFGVEAGVNYKSSELIKYYYTIAPTEALSRLTKYELQSALNYHLKMAYEYPISEQLSFDMKLKYTWLDSELANNPIINENGYFSGFIGVTYHF